MPSATQIRLEPAGEVHRSIGRRDADVAEITGTIASRNVHAAAKRDREVSIVAADPAPFLEDLFGGFAGRRMRITKGDVPVDEIADCLDSRPAGRSLTK